jgi:hypothetical protein
MFKNQIHLVIVALLILLSIGCIERKPKILIIGDSISIGYTTYVKEYFLETAIVSHNPGNAQHTGNSLEKIEKWIRDKDFDVIQFNWGLWDLCYRNPDSKNHGNRDKEKGKVTFTIDEYKSNLDSLVAILKQKTDAKLIFVTTTYVPKEEPGRYYIDVEKYNDIAKLVMKKHGILVNDLYQESIAIHTENGKGSKDVHYSKKGYKKLSNLIIKFLENEIEL